MSTSLPTQEPDYNDPAIRIEDLGPPRGTLAIVLIFGLLFGLAWVAMYVFEFMGRGAPHSH